MKILSTTKLAAAIKYYRENEGLSIEDFSHLTGLNIHKITRIESGNYVPTIDQFEALSEYLNIDLNLLLEDNQEQNAFELLRKETFTQSEEVGLETLFSMMTALKQQINLRRAFEDSSFN
jgi:transcriptional regulator with XRE-family HTH domain